MARIRLQRANETTGDWLRERRAALGLTQSELGLVLDVAPNTIARWERGETPVQHVGMLRAAMEYLAGSPGGAQGTAHKPANTPRALAESKTGTHGASGTPPATLLAPAVSLADRIERLYRSPIASQRTGPVYNSFSYPTKIDAETVALFIATHTQPGERVLDVFGGSGTTGVAARLCDRPTDRMKRLADELGLEPSWGPRDAVIYELSPVGALLSKVMGAPPNAAEFERAAADLIGEADRSFGWAYASKDAEGRAGQIRHTIWSEVLATPCCSARISLWDAAVSLDPVVLHETFKCPVCANDVGVAKCSRILRTYRDDVTGESVTQRERVPARVYGRTGSRTWSRPPTKDDLRLVRKIESTEPGTVPSGAIFWGDLYRSGYHTGIERYHQLYTPRNLRAIAHLWAGIDGQPVHLQDALRLWVLSYNMTHSTLLTRVVAKRNQHDFIVTGAQSGVLYVSGLPVEKNVFQGLHRKIVTFAEAFRLTAGSQSEVRVVCGSSTNVALPDSSVDYVFTDPPFGDFIPYAEVNQVNEAWLGRLTDRTEEAIVSTAQAKDVSAYGTLITRIFSEVRRVLKPTGKATVVFHASKPPVWQALGDAFRENRLQVERTSVLDKTQVSFKQVVSEGGTRGDALFLLYADDTEANDYRPVIDDLDSMIDFLIAQAGDNEAEADPRRLFGRYVSRCVEERMPVKMSARAFYERLTERLLSQQSKVVAASRR